MADPKNPQNTSTTDPKQHNLQKKEGQGVFGGNIDAFDAIAQQGVHQPDEHKNGQKDGVVHGHENDPIDPFLQSGIENQHSKEENIDIPDPFLVDENQDDQSGKNTEEDGNTAMGDVFDDDADTKENKEILKENEMEETTQKSPDIVSEKKGDEHIEEQNEDKEQGEQDQNDEEREKSTDTMKHESSLERQASASKNEDIEDDSDDGEKLKDMQEEDKEPTVIEENEEEPTKDQSPLQGKFQELFVLVQQVIDIHTKLHDGSFSLVGADNDISFVEYTFEQAENSITIYKNALDKKTNENEEHILVFTLDGSQEVSLHVVVDDTLLFDENEIVGDQSANVQIMDKISKFLFLVGQEKKSLDKAYEEYQDKQSKKEKVQTFRNF